MLIFGLIYLAIGLRGPEQYWPYVNFLSAGITGLVASYFHKSIKIQSEAQ